MKYLKFAVPLIWIYYILTSAATYGECGSCCWIYAMQISAPVKNIPIGTEEIVIPIKITPSPGCNNPDETLNFITSVNIIPSDTPPHQWPLSIQGFIPSQANPGMNINEYYFVWDISNIDSNFYDIVIPYNNRYCTCNWWASYRTYSYTPFGQYSNPNITDFELHTEGFNPHKNIPMKLSFSASDWAYMKINIIDKDTGKYVNTLFGDYFRRGRGLLPPGKHEFYWDGRDRSGNFYNGNVQLSVPFFDSVRQSGGILINRDADRLISYPKVKPYLIKIFNDEAAEISYNLTHPAYIHYRLYSPSGLLCAEKCVNYKRRGYKTEILTGQGFLGDESPEYFSEEGEYTLEITASVNNISMSRKCVIHIYK